MERRLTAAERHRQTSVECKIEKIIAHQHRVWPEIRRNTVDLSHTTASHIHQHTLMKLLVHQIESHFCLTLHKKDEPAIFNQKRSIMIQHLVKNTVIPPGHGKIMVKKKAPIVSLNTFHHLAHFRESDTCKRIVSFSHTIYNNVLSTFFSEQICRSSEYHE